ncbi:MAG: 5-carboxymethyl-2-hydroxymuconate Delta-isomerase [Paracoccaceae bacterium]
MPHLTVEYSGNLERETNLTALCHALHGCMVASGLFELGAIRVRARPCPNYAVADLLPQNAFADIILRIGQGRSEADRKAIGAALMAEAEAHFAPQLAHPHFALSLEVQEISAPFSWKTNAIHSRLRTR